MKMRVARDREIIISTVRTSGWAREEEEGTASFTCERLDYHVAHRMSDGSQRQIFTILVILPTPPKPQQADCGVGTIPVGREIPDDAG